MMIKKKAMAIFLSFLLVLVPFGSASASEVSSDPQADTATASDMLCSVSAFAAAGDTFDTAAGISVGTAYSGTISEDNTSDWYKFTLDTSGTLTFKATGYLEGISYLLYDEDGENIWSDSVKWDSSTEVSSFTYTSVLTSGTYYLLVNQYFYTSWYGSTSYYDYYGDYSFQTSFSSAGETFSETQGGSDNTIATANSISVGTTYKGQIAENDSADFYGFTLSSTGTLSIDATSYITKVTYAIYDKYGTQLWSSTRSQDSTLGFDTMSTSVCLNSGTYYLKVKQSSGYGNYSFKLGFTSAGESFKEPENGNNNTLDTADSISLRSAAYTGQLSVNDVIDVYTFTVSSKNSIEISFASGLREFDCYIYDSTGSKVWSHVVGTSYVTRTEDIEYTEYETLSAGTYYLLVTQDSSDQYGAYTFSLNYYVETPAFTKVKAGKKKLKLKWSLSDSSGVTYQVAYRKKGSKKWKKVSVKSKSKTIKKLKSKKTYQVRVRAVKKIGGKKYYSSWSAVKKAKIK